MFRDNREAMLARSDALQQANDRLERQLTSAEGERDELKRSLAANQAELAKLKKRLAKLERPSDPAAPTRLVLIAIAVALLVAGAVAAILFSKASSAVDGVRVPEENPRPAGGERLPRPPDYERR